MKRAILVAVTMVAGMAIGAVVAAPGGGRAQDTDAARIAALETQVAQTQRFALDFSSSISAMLLPAPETAPTYTANTLRVHSSSVFRLYCTLHDTAIMSVPPLYALDCSRIDPSVDPLLNR